MNASTSLSVLAAFGASTWNDSPRTVMITGLVSAPLPTSTESTSAIGTAVSSSVAFSVIAPPALKSSIRRGVMARPILLES